MKRNVNICNRGSKRGGILERTGRFVFGIFSFLFFFCSQLYLA